MKVLVTGSAGFIGHNVSRFLLGRGDAVVGVDNLNSYYDVKLKHERNALLDSDSNYTFVEIDLCDVQTFSQLVATEKPDAIIHLAAQAGVRYSLEHPFAYEEANNKGTLSVLEAARHNGVKRVVCASSSSVYGGNTKTPFSETDDVSKPVSLYAATKRSNELVGHTYHHLYGLEIAMLRFFTVYGPMGRPDMAYFSFAEKMLAGETIQIFNKGDMARDFTYIDDIVAGVIGSLDKRELGYEIYNLGGDNPVRLMDFVQTLEKHMGIEAKKEFVGMQAGDVQITMADISKARTDLGYEPKTSLDEGLKLFVEWFKGWKA